MIIRHYYVECDDCGIVCYGITQAPGDPERTYTSPAAVARERAYERGWRRVRVDGRVVDLCKVCVAERRRLRAERRQAEKEAAW